MNDPHAPASAADSATWLPLDVKPTSLPSSFSLSGTGLVPFALLGTANIDPLSQINIGSIRVGVLGSEVPVTRCQASGEDRNADGRLDLVCWISKESLRSSGVTTKTSFLSVTGLLNDGSDFYAQDDVKVTR